MGLFGKGNKEEKVKEPKPEKEKKREKEFKPEKEKEKKKKASFVNENTSGFKRFKNPDGWTNETLLEKLSGVSVSCGAPTMGTIKVMGKPKEAVIYPQSGDGGFIAYAMADEKKIVIGKVPDPGSSGNKTAGDIAGFLITGKESAESNKVNRAIDELQDVMEKLLAGEEVTESNAASMSDATKLYMRQSILTLRDKYSICTEVEEPVYWVVGSLGGMSFSIQNAAGEELMTVKKKVSIMSEYVMKQNGEEIAHVKKKVKLGRDIISGDAGGRELTIKGDMAGYSFSILLDDMMVGSVDTVRLTWADCYAISILDESIQDLVVAIAVICDNMLKSKDD